MKVEITAESSVTEVAAIISQRLSEAGITATLSGGSAVTIYSDNRYQSHDLDFVTAAMAGELEPVLVSLGFYRTDVPRLSQFRHPLVDWYVEFPPRPLSFGNHYVDHQDCGRISLPVGELRIITATQCVMDRLAAAIAWHDPQAREQATLVASSQDVDWEALRDWFRGEGESDSEYERFREGVERKRQP